MTTYRFVITAPDGVHQQDEIFDTEEDAVSWFKNEHKIYNQISPTKFVDRDGFVFTIEEKLEVELTEDEETLQDIMVTTWDFLYSEIKQLSKESRGMLSDEASKFIEKMTPLSFKEILVNLQTKLLVGTGHGVLKDYAYQECIKECEILMRLEGMKQAEEMAVPLKPKWKTEWIKDVPYESKGEEEEKGVME